MISEKNTKPELLEEYKKLMTQAKASKKSVSSVRSMSAKNTKADIWSEIQKLQKLLASAAKANTPATVPEKKQKPVLAENEKTNEFVADREEQLLENVVSTVMQINEIVKQSNQEPEIKEENDLSYLNQEIIEEINALTTAKAMKEKEYQSLCTVETELKKFAVMINHFKNERAEQEESHVQKEADQKIVLDELTAKIQESNTQKFEEAEKSLRDAEEMIEADKKKIAEERAVEEEKYSYEKTRKYREEDDKWADEVAQREEIIQAVKKETVTLQAEIDAKAEYVKDLTAKIEKIPELLEKAKQEAAEAKEKELNKEHGYKKHMAQKDADAAIQSLERQIAHVKADYEAALIEKNVIQEKLDKAYEESNKLYMQTVQSTGGIKILNNSDKN
ncbi:MAG: hypothetical protein K2H89_02200 [Oscillospiraceae bacterium]|nr:hypothetical protein [Oscillospiraceae bacterium]